MMKKVTAILFLVLLLFENVFAAETASEKEEIKVMLEGQEIIFADQQPIIKAGRTLVPARSVFEELGAVVSWNGETQMVKVEKDETVVQLTIGSDIFLKNGEEKKLDVPAEIINERTMIPLRAVSEALGCFVNWNRRTRTAFIYDIDLKNPKDRILSCYLQEGIYEIDGHIETEYGTVLHGWFSTSRSSTNFIRLFDDNGGNYGLTEAVQQQFPYNSPVLEDIQLSENGESLTYSVHYEERGTSMVVDILSGKKTEVVLYEPGTYYFTANLETKTSVLSSYLPMSE